MAHPDVSILDHRPSKREGRGGKNPHDIDKILVLVPPRPVNTYMYSQMEYPVTLCLHAYAISIHGDARVQPPPPPICKNGQEKFLVCWPPLSRFWFAATGCLLFEMSCALLSVHPTNLIRLFRYAYNFEKIVNYSIRKLNQRLTVASPEFPRRRREPIIW